MTKNFDLLVTSRSNGVNTTIEYILEVHSISPMVGSLLGGTRLTITGSGFSDVTSHNQVFFGSAQGKRSMRAHFAFIISRLPPLVLIKPSGLTH